MTIRIAIAGARGRMGTAAVKALMDIEDMEVVAALDYKGEGLFLHGESLTDDVSGIPVYTSFDLLSKRDQTRYPFGVNHTRYGI